ncbi:SDR family NAD(P)-dependent oxidoreductase [Paraferrimonas sp. SM1919]|uniref:SDR family NAD(P)-dependent oxidoreductase n=1 Tax=Paraferrimonas sp. SM1919 TaxID=2662263 RepID=UPI0013D16CF3|nr:SDR family NAD(P)-dependent oxidoreductase [Paraferrimonas sp. SM1919]
MELLKGKVAIVTGAAHPLGMGFSGAKKMAEAGAKVVITDMVREPQHQANIEARAAELRDAGFEAIALPVDVTNREQINACVEKTIEHYGRIDILFNNAGSPAGVGDFLEMTDQQWDISYQVNVKGVVNFCQAVIPHMQKAGGGSIINNSSLLGLGALAHTAGYCATKFALIGLTKTLACEFGKDNIRVNAICPGNIWTQMSELEVDLHVNAGEGTRAEVTQKLVDDVALGRWGKADDIGNAVVFLASDMGSYLSGVSLPVAGGLASGL